MTRMTGPDCAVMCNLINTHTHTHTHTHTWGQQRCTRFHKVGYLKLTYAVSPPRCCTLNTASVAWINNCSPNWYCLHNSLQRQSHSILLPGGIFWPLCHHLYLRDRIVSKSDEWAIISLQYYNTVAPISKRLASSVISHQSSGRELPLWRTPRGIL